MTVNPHKETVSTCYLAYDSHTHSFFDTCLVPRGFASDETFFVYRNSGPPSFLLEFAFELESKTWTNVDTRSESDFRGLQGVNPHSMTMQNDCPRQKTQYLTEIGHQDKGGESGDSEYE